MQCLQCGAEQTEDSRFCPKCGTRLPGTSTSPTEGIGAPDKVQVSSSSKEEEERILRELKEALKGVQEPDPSSPSLERFLTSISKKIWITGAAVALLILLIFAMALMRRHRRESAPPPSPPVETALPPQTVSQAPVDEATRTSVGKIAAMLEAINHYSKTKKNLPPALTSLNQSYSDPSNIQDGWGQNIFYLVDLTNKTFVIRSPGPDGKRETSDDISVTNETADEWLKEHEQTINEWRVANPNLYAQLTSGGPTPEELKRLEAARKAEEEKKKQEVETKEMARRKQREEEQKKLELARLEEDKRKQNEAKRKEEELRQAKAREEELRLREAARHAVDFKDNFTEGLVRWDAPSSWEIVKEKELSALRVQGLGLLKQGEEWDNYKMEFEVRINKESAGWVIRAQNPTNFYLFKLASEKAKAIPRSSLVKYIFSDGKYLNSLKREDAPGAAGVTPLPFKVNNKDYYRVVVILKGTTMRHYINGIEVDSWSDNTFEKGRFGFNASIIEMATIRGVSAEPLR